MTNSRSFKTTLRIQPQLNSTQTSELGTTQLKLVFMFASLKGGRAEKGEAANNCF